MAIVVRITKSIDRAQPKHQASFAGCAGKRRAADRLSKAARPSAWEAAARAGKEARLRVAVNIGAMADSDEVARSEVDGRRRHPIGELGDASLYGSVIESPVALRLDHHPVPVPWWKRR